MSFLRNLIQATLYRSTAADMQHQWELAAAHRAAEAARAEAATLRAHLDKLREPTAVDLIASQTRIDEAAREVYTIAEHGPDRWRTSIPARPGYDSDRVIDAGLREGDKLVREVGRLRDLVTEILGRFTQPAHVGEPCRSTGWISEKQISAWRHAAGPQASGR